MSAQQKGEDSPHYKKDALRRNKEHGRERLKAWRLANKEKYKMQSVRSESVRAIKYRIDPSIYLWKVAKTRAKKYGVVFDIMPEDIVIPSKCPILGVDIDILTSNYGTGASLDKIDNSIGYVKGNVRVISRKANRLKGDATINQLLNIVAYMRGEI